ncbi:hypothetical protein CLG85_022005 [Yangia mangrovi]|uniref:Tyr recombinase domain-containing protein n=1 Tax=Alloyangia mangrovi TaxID=1779329 RepID=A0A2A3JYP1_9RHOB|nr:hypothetical protein [Alloyangia mangrovi]MCT4372833.1 hypothetical protein [Alloyangia mangrovi]
MARKRKFDRETARLWERLTERHPDYPEARRASILSAYRGYRETFGSRLASDAELHAHLVGLFEDKGAQQGYAVAMHLRDALRALGGDDFGARVTRHVRNIQPRSEKDLASEWSSVRGAAERLPAAWRALFLDHVGRCESGREPPGASLSPSTLQGMAEALAGWARFREGDLSEPLTGAELSRYAAHLRDSGLWETAVLSTATKIHMCYRHILAPGGRSHACQTVLKELKGRATAAGPCRKSPSQIVPASLIYRTGLGMMAEVRTGECHDLRAATVYRNGLLLTLAAAVPLRRRALASLDLATSLCLQDCPSIKIDIAGRYLKLRQDRKSYERYQAYLASPVLWDAVQLWSQRFRPMFGGGTALFPSVRLSSEALVPDVLGQVFGDTTEERLGVRVPIHRIRDCVATEAIEEMEHGAGWARHLLDHKSAQTTARFYDHSTGVTATRAFGQLLTKRRSDPVELIL